MITNLTPKNTLLIPDAPTSSVFGDPCPATSKYAEVHYHCVPVNEVTTKKYPAPPWLLDLSATFVPDSERQNVTETTMKVTLNISTTSQYKRLGENGETSKSSKRGRYYLINEERGDKESNKMTLILGITVSTISTLISVLAIYRICSKYSKKRPTDRTCDLCDPAVGDSTQCDRHLPNIAEQKYSHKKIWNETKSIKCVRSQISSSFSLFKPFSAWPLNPLQPALPSPFPAPPEPKARFQSGQRRPSCGRKIYLCQSRGLIDV